MPYISSKDVQKLAEVEAFLWELWERLDWKNDGEEEYELAKLCGVVERALSKQESTNKKAKEYMNFKRATDLKYDRSKK